MPISSPIENAYLEEARKRVEARCMSMDSAGRMFRWLKISILFEEPPFVRKPLITIRSPGGMAISFRFQANGRVYILFLEGVPESMREALSVGGSYQPERLMDKKFLSPTDHAFFRKILGLVLGLDDVRPVREPTRPHTLRTGRKNKTRKPPE